MSAKLVYFIGPISSQVSLPQHHDPSNETRVARIPQEAQITVRNGIQGLALSSECPGQMAQM